MAGRVSFYQKNKHLPEIRARYQDAKARWLAKQSPDRRSAYFRSCSLSKKYGITLEQWEELSKKQQGTCAICKCTPIRTKRGGLVVDHDHATGRIRGLLCHTCNHAIERVEKFPDWGQLALAYLRGENQ